MGRILSALVAGLVLAASCANAYAQKSIKEQLAGAWTLVAVTSEGPDGAKGQPFGPNPKGVIVFSSDGYFSLLQSRGEVPKIAANDRTKATAEEAQGIVASTIAYYGTYTVNETDRTLSVKLLASTFANLLGGPEQKRIITALTADVLNFTNPRTPAGVTLLTAWKRAAPP
jgi:hypothetical protein